MHQTVSLSPTRSRPLAASAAAGAIGFVPATPRAAALTRQYVLIVAQQPGTHCGIEFANRQGEVLRAPMLRSATEEGMALRMLSR
jgi:hypothetical protein